MSSVGNAVKSVGSTSAALCETAEVIFYGCTVVIPEAFFCAQTANDGKGDSGKILDAAQAWWEAGDHLREFHDELEALIRSIPESDWKAADRESYEQQAEKYLEQVKTSMIAAEAASVMLDTAGAALFAFAVFALGVAAALAIDAASVAAADCTVVGAPAAEAEANVAGAEAFELLETGTQVLFGALSGVAVAMGAGAFADFGVLEGQGDSAAGGDFGHAVVSGLKTDASMLPKEAADYAQGKILDHFHEKWFPKNTHVDGAGSDESGSSSSSSSSGDGGSSSSGDGGSTGSGDGGSPASGGSGSPASGESGGRTRQSAGVPGSPPP